MDHRAILPPPLPRSISADLNRQLFARDLGRCQLCDLDLFGIRLQLTEYHLNAVEQLGGEMAARAATRRYARIAYPGVAGAFPYQLWHFHHVVAVAEGGPTTLENLITVCKPCHRVETAKLLKRLALYRSRSAYRPFVQEEMR